MRIQFLLASTFSLLLVSLLSNASCPDLSGSYRSAYESESSATISTIIYNQTGCDSLLILGKSMAKPPFESRSRVFNALRISLKNPSAPQGLQCWNIFPGACASYQATEKNVIKTLNAKDSQLAIDIVHGSCSFRISWLSKNKNGDLLEQIQDAQCEDGYEGALEKAILWPLQM